MLKTDAEHLKAYFIQWLLKGNLSFDKKNNAIGTEVSFSSNRRKADLVILDHELHAFEIKGGYDTLRKLEAQLVDYHKTFNKVTVITTPKHLIGVRKIIMRHTGLILHEDNNFKVVKKAKIRKRLDKYSLLMFLKKSEIAKLLKLGNINNYSTDQVRNIAKEKLTLNEVHQVSSALLQARYKRLFKLFLKDRGKKIHIDDLMSLSGRVEDLVS